MAASSHGECMTILRCLGILFFLTPLALWSEEKITPYKFEEEVPSYEIPASCRWTVNRSGAPNNDIVFYRSLPESKGYPIAILCGGSSDKEHLSSIIHFHRYFLQECEDLGLAVVTVEQWGIDGGEIDKEEFIAHYTRSQRLSDHIDVIEHLKANPFEGWNGKFIFIGVSEGGPLVTSLSTEYSTTTIATINWSGAGVRPWREELWVFLQQLVEIDPECPHSVPLGECEMCFELITTREKYDALMDFIMRNPTSEEFFMNMSYLYHTDAQAYPCCNFGDLSSPYLVVSGALDTIIDSSDEFVAKANAAGAPITYMRVPDMDHYIRKRPDVIEASFSWLRNQIPKYRSGAHSWGR